MLSPFTHISPLPILAMFRPTGPFPLGPSNTVCVYIYNTYTFVTRKILTNYILFTNTFHRHTLYQARGRFLMSPALFILHFIFFRFIEFCNLTFSPSKPTFKTHMLGHDLHNIMTNRTKESSYYRVTPLRST